MEDTQEVNKEDLSLEKLESMAYNLYIEIKINQQKGQQILNELKTIEDQIVKKKQAALPES